MKKLGAFATALVLIASPTFAAINPASLTVSNVVDTCAAVASTQTAKENPNAGKCYGATNDFLVGLAASGATGDAIDTEIRNLIGKLTPLVADRKTCDAVDDEVARAIRLAKGYAKDGQLATQLGELADTIAACQFDGTAALPVFPSPTV